VNCATEREPNDSPTTAHQLCSDGTLRGAINAAGDVDWYVWSLAAGRNYWVTLGQTGGQLALYKVANGQLALVGTAAQQIARYTPDGGVYYLQISAPGGATGTYDLSVDVQTP
jgi:hypothetical protein